MLGYRNRLVSQNLERLQGVEPGHGTDEWKVESFSYSLEEIQAAEESVREILERDRSLLTALAEALIAKGVLDKDEVRKILTEAAKKS